MQQPVIIKLTTGDDIVACMASESDQSVILEFPMLIDYGEVEDEGGGIDLDEMIILRPYVDFTDDVVFRLPKSLIVVAGRVNDKMMASYREFVESYAQHIAPATVEDTMEVVSNISPEAITALINRLSSESKSGEIAVVPGNNTLQ